MDKEEAVRVVSIFDPREAREVVAPVGVPKIGFEVVGFGDVGATVASESSFMQRCTAAAALRPFATSGSCPEIPGYAGAWPSATMARAKAAQTAGFIAVFFAATLERIGNPAVVAIPIAIFQIAHTIRFFSERQVSQTGASTERPLAALRNGIGRRVEAIAEVVLRHDIAGRHSHFDLGSERLDKDT